MPGLKAVPAGVRSLHRPAAAVLSAALLTAAFAPNAGASPAPYRVMAQWNHVRHAPNQRGCADAQVPSVSASTQAMRRTVVCLINRQRTMRGLPPLRSSRRLNRSAQHWSDAMVARASFTHGINFASRISAAGFAWQAAGENIATGFPTPASVVTAWMASTDHCQNILSPTYTSVGTGLNRHPVGAFGGGPATWTQDFALPLGAHAPSGNTRPARGCPY